MRGKEGGKGESEEGRKRGREGGRRGGREGEVIKTRNGIHK